MITTNLATRPFYNDRAVRLALLLAVVVIAAFTVFNVNRVIHYSRNETALGQRASDDERRADELRAQARQLRASVDPKQIELVAGEARKANDLIDRRTFSWTELFNQFETTLPDEVKITSMRPKVDAKTGTSLTVTVVARGVDDVNEFMSNLEKTGAFQLVGSRFDEHVNEQGQLEASFEMRYGK